MTIDEGEFAMGERKVDFCVSHIMTQ
jgi:hypothetical protein